MKLCLIYRSKERKRFSIENVFNTVKAGLDDSVEVEECYLPRASYRSIKDILDNIKYARQKEADIYHITGEVHFAALGLPRDKCVITIHDLVGLEKHYKGLKKALFWLLWYYLPLRRCAQVTCISDTTRDALTTRFPFCERKIHVIPNPLDKEFVRCDKEFNSECTRILVIGTTPVKNVSRIIDAVKTIHCHLDIVGVLNRELNEKLNEAGISYSNEAAISKEEVIKHYIECDILCFASEYEGFGMPIIEAQAIGRPVVTSNIAPMNAVAGDGACLVNPFDVNSIREGLKKVINDSDYRQRLVQNGFVNVQKYDASLVADKYSEIYRQMSCT